MFIIIQKEWILDFGCSCHMVKDASLFSSLCEAKEDNIWIVDDYALIVISSVQYYYGNDIVPNKNYVANVSANRLYTPQIIQNCKKVEF